MATSKPEIIEIIAETPRLRLRKFLEADFEDLYLVLSHPEVMRFSVRGPYDRDGIARFLDVTQKRYEKGGVAQWAVVLKETGKCIGECGISVQDIDGKKQHEIGYRLARPLWGKGYATEAAMACREYGFNVKGLTRMISIIETENHASIRVAEKVGMKLEKESVFHEIPVRIYSLSKVDS